MIKEIPIKIGLLKMIIHNGQIGIDLLNHNIKEFKH
jgi:hypothetical protein